MSEKIDLAKNKMDEIQSQIMASDEQKKLLPRFHFSSPCGWINDPNGFSFFKGEYHLFAQWHPYSNEWGPMHWCHAVSKNLVQWKYLSPAFAPDTDSDCEGCFSGSAVEDCGKLVLAYTGVSKKDDIPIQNQCIAIFDGEEFVKSKLNPVITSKDIPFEYNIEHFRDPKIWRQDGKYFLAAVIKKIDGHGAVVCFESSDLENWKFEGIVDEEKTSESAMWECPDIFSLDEKDVLIVSPQEMKADFERGFNKGNNTVYLFGKFDSKTKKFFREKSEYTMLDLGIDFYAAQTMQSPDGRRIMIAWMQNWDSYNTPKNYLWSGMMTFPRELKIKNGKLIQSPISELKKFFGKTEKGEISSGENNGAKIFNSRHCVLKLKITPNQNESGKLKLTVGSESQNAFVEFDSVKKTLSFNREKTIQGGGAINKKTIPVELDKNGMLDLLCLIDTSSIEIFINGGEKVFTNNFFISSDEEKITVSSTLENVVKFECNEI